MRWLTGKVRNAEGSLGYVVAHWRWVAHFEVRRLTGKVQNADGSLGYVWAHVKVRMAHLDIGWLTWRCGGSLGDEMAHLEMRWLTWSCDVSL